MHWTYKNEADASLEQGDILERSDYLVDVLSKYHPYYVSRHENELFIVLTQSCELFERDGSCKSPYITLAPIRPLRVIIEKEFGSQLQNKKTDTQPYGSWYLKNSFSDFLEKLFNNNDPKYFFISQQPDMKVAEDMCALTSLSISIKSEHYAECIKARILQLDDTFQAKLGWLVGQKFSRVGTKDWPEDELGKIIKNVISNTAVWVKDDQIGKLNKAVKEYEEANPKNPVDETTLAKLISTIPDKKEQAIDSLFKVLVDHKIIPEGKDPRKFELRKKLRSDPEFSQHFK